MEVQPERPAVTITKNGHHNFKLWTKSFITLTVSYLLLFLCLQMLLSPFPTYVKEKFNPGDFTVSLVISVFAFAAIAARFVTAALMRKFSARNVQMMYVGLLLAAAATAAYPFASSVGSLLALRIVFGIGFGMASTVMPTLVAQIIPSHRLGEGIGYFGMSTTIAMSVGPVIGLAVLGDFGFVTLASMGTLSALIAMPLAYMSASARKDKPQPPASKPLPAADTGKSRFNAMLLLPAGLNVLLSITYGGLLSFLALYGKERHMDHIALFFLFNALAAFIVRPISGRLFDSKGHIAVIIPGAICSFVGLVLVSYTDSLPLLFIAALIYGAGYGSIQPTLQAWMLQLSKPHEHGTANGLYYNALDFGVATGSMLLGAIASASSYAIMYRISSLSMILFLALYAAILAAIARKDRAAQKSGERLSA